MIFNNEKQLKVLVDRYFNSMKGEILLNEENMPVLERGKPVYEIEPQVPTLSGLASALGFSKRDELLSYNGTALMNEIISSAILKIEEFIEQKLFESGAMKGAQYILENDFGWNKACNDEDESNKIEVKIKVID